MKLLVLLLTFFVIGCADTKDCVCLRSGGMPDVNNPLVIPKGLDGKPLILPTPE